MEGKIKSPGTGIRQAGPRDLWRSASGNVLPLKVQSGHRKLPPMLPLERPAARHLVGVSGGADSVALLHLLVEGGSRNLVVCHLHHGLRGRDATADQHFTARLAKQLGLPFETGRVDVRKLAKASGESLETAARPARHEFFARCAKFHRCPRVILAHHADDQAETILWNLLRGSHGLKGMSANQHIMAGGRQLVLFRPLLANRPAAPRDWPTP